MVEISIGKILGTENQDVLLPLRKPRTSRPSKQNLCLLIATILLVQSIITYRLLIYEAPFPEFAPYNTTETVDLITKWYELLQDMNYLGPDAIAYAPHVGDKAINITLATQMGLDPRVIETMQQMPYITSKTGGWMLERDVLFRDSRFVDYRRDSDLFLSRDPLGHWEIYNAKQSTQTFEDAMLDFDVLFPKSAVPLSIVRGGIWGTGDAIVLDTATNRIHIISTQGTSNQDPFFKQFARDARPVEYRTKTPYWYSEDIQYVRSAREVLTDFILSTALLKDEFVPGSPYPDSYAPELCPPKWQGWVRDLYHRSGWPAGVEVQQYMSNDSQPLDLTAFKNSNISREMIELRHNITVKYMPDWFVPVPRNETFIKRLLKDGDLNQEQLAFARSDEEVIPFDSEGWGARYLFSKHWEVYGKGNW